MSDFIRARSSAQKEQRMTEIKQACETLYSRQAYHEITLASIAEELGWSRAALYKYVTTKEEIFLEICADKRNDYNQALLAAYPEGSSYSPAVLAEVWTEQLYSHLDYLRYCDLLFSIIETNVTVERLAEFKRGYFEGQNALVERFSKNLSIAPERADSLLNSVYFHAMEIAAWCAENPLVKQAVELAGYQDRQIDFRSEMRDFITMCLGYYTRP